MVWSAAYSGGMTDGAGWLTKPLMFLSSYAPLFVMLAIRFEDSTLRLWCTLIATAGAIALPVVMSHQRRGSPGEHIIVSVQTGGTGASSYLAGYLLPFLTVSRPTTTDLVAYGLFLLVALLVHLRTEIIQVNPTLFIFGWRIYAFTDSKGLQGHIISRARVVSGDTVRAYRMTNDVLLQA